MNDNINLQLWSIANDLRGNMASIEFKSYIMGMLFYKYLSKKLEMHMNNILVYDGLIFEEAYNNNEYKEKLKNVAINEIGYFIEPNYLFKNLVKKAEASEFIIDDLYIAFNYMDTLSLNTESHDDFVGLFDDVDLYNNKLGVTQNERNEAISLILLKLNKITIFDSSYSLSDSYEYLLTMFANDAGKKGGELYTPNEVSTLVAKIATHNKQNIKTIYDPTCGTGSLLLKTYEETQNEECQIYGQELNTTTYNVARMNMFLHGINYQNFTILQGNTLTNDRFEDKKFECIIATPPFGAKWEHNSSVESDPRFSKYGKLAPKSKAEFAFVQHMLYHLDDNGTMATIVPHGVLFRGAAESYIRQFMIEQDNVLDAVIGLPANLFFGTGIPAVVLVFKKDRTKKDILFIDASRDFEKVKTQNVLRTEDIEKIFNTYINREEIDKYSRNVTLKEIKENEYNLNILRYIDTFEEEEEIDMDELRKKKAELQEQIAKKKAEIDKILKEVIA